MTATTASAAPPAAELFPDLDQVEAHFHALTRPDEVREVRILEHLPASGYGGPSTASGYFDNAEALVDELREIGSQHAAGIYITQNPVDRDLLARAHNRLRRKAKQTTADADILRLTHLTYDFDPVRKAGISATDDELTSALATRDAFIQFVTIELGWPEPLVVMMSGNGGQVTWRIDLPTNAEGAALVQAVLEAADAMFSTQQVSVDTTLGNPSRIVKLSGTVAAKGDPLPGRPHRRAQSTFHPNAGTVSEAHLRALIALAPPPFVEARPQNGHHTSISNGHRIIASSGDPYDIPTLLRGAGIEYRERNRDYGCVFDLDRCLSSSDHNDGAAIVQFSSGAVSYRCHHNRCRGIGWQDVKARLGIPTTSNSNGHDHKASVTIGSVAPDSAAPERAWPTLDEAALYGLAGDVVRTIEPHTEGDPVAILLNFLTMYGSAIGPSPHAQVGATRHSGVLYVVHVGKTARARKGTAHDEVERLMRLADPEWGGRIVGGISSGEGLIHAVRDASYKTDKNGDMVLADIGVKDKRLLVVEPEYSLVLRVAGREGNTVSEQLRRGWDGKDMQTMTRSLPLTAKNPHISILGHITADELRRELTETAQSNGYANRHLFSCAKRSKLLPEGGSLSDNEIARLVERLKTTIAHARHRYKLVRNADAKEMWAAVYPALTEEKPGMIGAITARAEAQVLRLCLLYALLDRSEEIGPPHLQAALAVWEYAERSAVYIFGDATGDPIADAILRALRTNGRMNQTQISELFSKNQKAGRIQQALVHLLDAGKVRTWEDESDRGRRPTYWEATP